MIDSHKLIDILKEKAIERAKEWATDRGVCGAERFKMMYENALILVTMEECCIIADSQVDSLHYPSHTIKQRFGDV